jgi:hypothetical protein
MQIKIERQFASLYVSLQKCVTRFSWYHTDILLTTAQFRDSVVVIATRYELEGPGIETRWGEIFRTYPDRLRGPSSLLYNGYRVFPGGKGGRGVMLTTHSLLVPRLKKELSYTSTHPMGPHGPVRSSLYLLLLSLRGLSGVRLHDELVLLQSAVYWSSTVQNMGLSRVKWTRESSTQTEIGRQVCYRKSRVPVQTRHTISRPFDIPVQKAKNRKRNFEEQCT